MKSRQWIIAGLFTPLILSFTIFNTARAQTCPTAGSSLTQVRYAVDDFIRNGRAPAGADCAYSWADSVDLTSLKLDDALLMFFRSASDVQRAAALKRLAANNTTESEQYLKQEMDLRKRLVDEALSRNSDPNETDRLRPYVVKNLSYIVSALALTRKYQDVAVALSNQDPSYVDNEALKVWLQALWSCAKWDGNKQNVCSHENKQICKDKIVVFLDSLNGMGMRKLPPQTRLDIDGLRTITKKGGCLQ